MPNAEGRYMPRGVTEIVEPTLERAMYDLRWYANGLCKVKPERYEVFQDRSGTTALSDSCRVVLDALAARTREVEEMREANVAADGTARAAVELVQDCRQVLGLDRGDSLTAAVMRAAKDARRYHALRAFLRPEMWGRRWQVVVEADDLRNALAATYSFDTREAVDTDAVVDALAAQEGTCEPNS